MGKTHAYDGECEAIEQNHTTLAILFVLLSWAAAAARRCTPIRLRLR